MNRKLSGILGIILSILLLIYFESFFYKILGLLGISILSFSNIMQIIINLCIKLIICFIIYIIYKKDFKSKRRNSYSFFKTLLVFFVSLIFIVIGMYLFNYVVEFIGDIFNVSVLEKSFYNIFDKELNFNLIVKIITDYILMPYLYCSVIILSMDKIMSNNNTCVIFSGILASIIYAFSIHGTLSFVIVNSLSMFLLFSILAFIYRKNYSIYFIICLYSFYLISNVFIINYIGW